MEENLMNQVNNQNTREYNPEKYQFYNKEDLVTSSCKPSNILLYFDFGYIQNQKLHKELVTRGYKHIDNNLCPISSDGTIREIPKETYIDITGKFLHEMSSLINQKQKMFTPANFKLVYFLLSNNITFDIIFPNRNVMDWILNEYLESDYSSEYLRHVFAQPEDNLSSKTNYVHLSHMYYNIPQSVCNKIMITTPSDIAHEYRRYFNFKNR